MTSSWCPRRCLVLFRVPSLPGGWPLLLLGFALTAFSFGDVFAALVSCPTVPVLPLNDTGPSFDSCPDIGDFVSFFSNLLRSEPGCDASGTVPAAARSFFFSSVSSDPDWGTHFLSFSLMFQCLYILAGPFKYLCLRRSSSFIHAAKVPVTLSTFCQAIMVFVPGDLADVPVTVCRISEAPSSRSQPLPFIASP